MNCELKFLLLKRYLLGLGESEERRYQILHQGYQGEQAFEHLIETIGFKQANSHCLLDWSLNGDGLTQIDALLLMPDHLILVNVKNYYFSNQRMKSQRLSAKIKHQLEKSKDVLWSVLERVGIQQPIKKALVFINPDLPHFYLDDGGPAVDYAIQAADVEYWLRTLMHQANKQPRQDYRPLINQLH